MWISMFFIAGQPLILEIPLMYIISKQFGLSSEVSCQGLCLLINGSAWQIQSTLSVICYSGYSLPLPILFCFSLCKRQFYRTFYKKLTLGFQKVLESKVCRRIYFNSLLHLLSVRHKLVFFSIYRSIIQGLGAAIFVY